MVRRGMESRARSMPGLTAGPARAIERCDNACITTNHRFIALPDGTCCGGFYSTPRIRAVNYSDQPGGSAINIAGMIATDALTPKMVVEKLLSNQDKPGVKYLEATNQLGPVKDSCALILWDVDYFMGGYDPKNLAADTPIASILKDGQYGSNHDNSGYMVAAPVTIGKLTYGAPSIIAVTGKLIAPQTPPYTPAESPRNQHFLVEYVRDRITICITGF
ncbi:hypothetical protein DdX_17392 [Ditylenchus destructor]|uniref:Uncharacterized protein n=1 Tax=Ditylenchus destructor TaxID=166010 RepID=A0AAD4MM82_9BILA|nr:hypothetical protein DdX_17392 [Ditylenchus destructor]